MLNLRTGFYSGAQILSPYTFALILWKTTSCSVRSDFTKVNGYIRKIVENHRLYGKTGEQRTNWGQIFFSPFFEGVRCLCPKQEPVGGTSCDKGLLTADLTTVNKDSDFDLMWGDRALLGNLWMRPQACSAILPAAYSLYRLGLICMEPICKTNLCSLLQFYASYLDVCVFGCERERESLGIKYRCLSLEVFKFYLLVVS